MRTLRSLLPKLSGDVVRLDPVWFRDDVPPERGDTVGYGKWKSGRDGDERLADYFISRFTGFSDYSGCDVERSNNRLFLEMLQESEGTTFLETSSGYGTTDILVRLDTTDDEVLDTLLALENYPAIDDEDVSRVEMELFDESWESWIASDLRKGIAKRFGGRVDLDEMPDEDLQELYRKLADRANVYPEVETGGSVYVDLDRIIAKVERSDIATEYDVPPDSGPCM